MTDHTVPPLTVYDACPSGRPYPHPWDAQCARPRGPSEVPTVRTGGTIRAADMTPLPDPPWTETPAALVLPGSEATSERAGDGGFWCALCATHRPTATEVYAHAAEEHPSSILALNGLREHIAQGVTPLPDLPVYIFTLPGGESMAARLRQVQADLTRAEQERDAVGVKLVAALREKADVERERDDARTDYASAAADLRETREALDLATWERDHARAELAAESRKVAQLQALLAEAARVRDLTIAELATASKEVRLLRAARQWIVARDGGRNCVRCEQEIRRGEAYELLDAADALAHIHCRTEREPTT